MAVNLYVLLLDSVLIQYIFSKFGEFWMNICYKLRFIFPLPILRVSPKYTVLSPRGPKLSAALTKPCLVPFVQIGNFGDFLFEYLQSGNY